MTNEDVCKAAESYEDGLIYSSIKDQCDIQKLIYLSSIGFCKNDQSLMNFFSIFLKNMVE